MEFGWIFVIYLLFVCDGRKEDPATEWTGLHLIRERVLLAYKGLRLDDGWENEVKDARDKQKIIFSRHKCCIMNPVKKKQ